MGGDPRRGNAGRVRSYPPPRHWKRQCREFDREGRWLESDIVRWKEGGREAFEERDLAEVLLAFGVPEAEAGAIAADMRAAAEPLVGGDESGWKDLWCWLGSFAVFFFGWILAVVLAVVLLVLVLA